MDRFGPVVVHLLAISVATNYLARVAGSHRTRPRASFNRKVINDDVGLVEADGLRVVRVIAGTRSFVEFRAVIEDLLARARRRS